MEPSPALPRAVLWRVPGSGRRDSSALRAAGRRPLGRPRGRLPAHRATSMPASTPRSPPCSRRGSTGSAPLSSRSTTGTRGPDRARSAGHRLGSPRCDGFLAPVGEPECRGARWAGGVRPAVAPRRLADAHAGNGGGAATAGRGAARGASPGRQRRCAVSSLASPPAMQVRVHPARRAARARRSIGSRSRRRRWSRRAASGSCRSCALTAVSSPRTSSLLSGRRVCGPSTDRALFAEVAWNLGPLLTSPGTPSGNATAALPGRSSARSPPSVGRAPRSRRSPTSAPRAT